MMERRELLNLTPNRGPSHSFFAHCAHLSRPVYPLGFIARSLGRRRKFTTVAASVKACSTFIRPRSFTWRWLPCCLASPNLDSLAAIFGAMRRRLGVGLEVRAVNRK